MEKSIVESIKISKQYGYNYALRSISLKIGLGEIVGISGHNGAGKSTFLKIIGTHLSPTSGKVKILDSDSKKDRLEVRKNIGFFGHNSFMYDELSVEENLQFYGKMFNIVNDYLDNRIDEVIEAVDLERYRHVSVKKLSHGLRKRSDLARIFLHSPSILILDEPFSGLDESAVKLLVDGLKNQESKAIIISSHTFELTNNLCNRNLVFSEGKIVSDNRVS